MRCSLCDSEIEPDRACVTFVTKREWRHLRCHNNRKWFPDGLKMPNWEQEKANEIREAS